MAISSTKTTKQVDALNEVYKRCKGLIQSVAIINKHWQLQNTETKGNALLARGELHSWLASKCLIKDDSITKTIYG